jgi:hypothetical protein
MDSSPLQRKNARPTVKFFTGDSSGRELAREREPLVKFYSNYPSAWGYITGVGVWRFPKCWGNGDAVVCDVLRWYVRSEVGSGLL